jgi:hypothetical protein
MMEALKNRKWSHFALIVVGLVGVLLGIVIAQIGGGAFFAPCKTANAANVAVPAGAKAIKPPPGAAAVVPAGAICGALGLPGQMTLAPSRVHAAGLSGSGRARIRTMLQRKTAVASACRCASVWSVVPHATATSPSNLGSRGWRREAC